PLDKWMGFHQYYDLQMNPFGKFRRREPYISLSDNDYIYNNFGIYAGDKVYSYVLWLENISRRIRRIRQKRALLNTQRQKGSNQIVNNIREMYPLCINKQDWMNKPRSLTP